MTTITIRDTYQIVQRLKEAGFAEGQAKALVDELKHLELDDMITKSDLHSLEIRLTEKVEGLHRSLLMWLVPLLLGQAGLITALAKLL